MQSMLSSVPFNISLLILTTENTRGLRPVKVLDIFAGAGGGAKDFHPDGLFSVETFGKIGEEKRNRYFGYIELNTQIFHPTIFKAILDLKELYGKIMAGTAYAIFDPELKDFVAATPANGGKTGYAFFVKHFPELKFEERDSTSRSFNIRMVNQNRQSAMMSKLIVMPAGLRDFTILENGKPEEDEINGLYRRVLSTANVITTLSAASDPSYLDAMRHSLQIATYEVYRYIVNLLEGKSKLIQGWWTNRNVMRSTRNVITSNVSTVTELGGPTTIGPNHTVVGMLQTMAAIFPLMVNLLREITAQVFTGPNAPAVLVNPKTLKKEIVSIHPDHYDRWMTQDGLETMLSHYEVEDFRHDAVMVDDYYFGLLYDDGSRVRFVQGVDDLPEGFDPKHLSPITFTELYYLAIAERVKTIPGMVTRYPILGFGSIYPSWIYLRTTVQARVVKKLGVDWTETDVVLNEFPIRGKAFMNSMSPAISHLHGLDADHDGDVCSLTCPLADESIDEIRNLLDSRDYYVSVNEEMSFSASNDISETLFLELTN